MGKTHPLDVVLDLAEAFTTIEDIHFIMIGGGDQLNSLKKIAELKKLINVSFLDWQPNELLSHSLSGADIAIVSIDATASNLSMPSKTFNLMAIGCPIMGIAPDDSALNKIITKFEIGRCFDQIDIKKMIDFIKYYHKNQDKLMELRKKSISASEYFSSKNARKFSDVRKNS